MARPETCDAAGGAISLWMNAPVDCSGFCGIISSYAVGGEQDQKYFFQTHRPGRDITKDNFYFHCLFLLL